MGGVAKNPIGTIGRGLAAGVTGGLSEFAQKNPFGAPVNNPINKALPINNDYLKTGSLFASDKTSIPGPFSLDPAQMAADQAAITGLGQKQYDQTLAELPKAVTNSINQALPGIEETLNSQHLLNSTALPQELARQSSNFAQNLAMPALQQLQGTQTAGLQRGLSLEDYINQANVAKTIGAQMAPPPPSGKAQAGTLMQGVGALAPLAKVGKVAAAPATGGGSLAGLV